MIVSYSYAKKYLNLKMYSKSPDTNLVNNGYNYLFTFVDLDKGEKCIDLVKSYLKALGKSETDTIYCFRNLKDAWSIRQMVLYCKE